MSESADKTNDDLEPEYRFDYRAAKLNRFAARGGRRVVVLDPEVAQAYPDSKKVNEALKRLMQSEAKPTDAAP